MGLVLTTSFKLETLDLHVHFWKQQRVHGIPILDAFSLSMHHDAVIYLVHVFNARVALNEGPPRPYPPSPPITHNLQHTHHLNTLLRTCPPGALPLATLTVKQPSIHLCLRHSGHQQPDIHMPRKHIDQTGQRGAACEDGRGRLQRLLRFLLRWRWVAWSLGCMSGRGGSAQRGGGVGEHGV